MERPGGARELVLDRQTTARTEDDVIRLKFAWCRPTANQLERRVFAIHVAALAIGIGYRCLKLSSTWIP